MPRRSPGPALDVARLNKLVSLFLWSLFPSTVGWRDRARQRRSWRHILRPIPPRKNLGPGAAWRGTNEIERCIRGSLEAMTQVHGTSLLRQIRKVVAAQCPSRQSDLALLQQFIAERDEAAFAALLQRHAPLVLGVCRNVLHHHQDAEDVFQAVFLVLARKPHTIRKQQALSSWLHGVAYRLALKARAQRARRQDRAKAATEPCSTGTVADDLTLRELGAIL